MAKKNIFNAETVYHDGMDHIVIQKKAVFSFVSLIPVIEAHGKRKPLSNKGFGIGRDKTNAVIVADSTVSKFHAFVNFRGGVAYIRDSGSTNGTWVNKKRVSGARAQALKNKDIILIGSTQIQFRC